MSKLSENDIDVLSALICLGDAWSRPMDFGAFDSSHHSGTATRLVARGLVERTDRLGGSITGRRKVWRYRITEAGRAAIEDATLSISGSAL